MCVREELLNGAQTNLTSAKTVLPSHPALSSTSLMQLPLRTVGH